MSDTIEIWKDIDGYEGMYQISNRGNVRALERICIRETIYGNIKRSEAAMATVYCRGYATVKICKHNKRKKFSIHRLIAIAFIPNPGNKPFVNHINGNPSDNRIENLEWVDNRENCSHGHTLRAKASKYTGVTWDKHRKKWKAAIWINNQFINIGRFESELEASDAYKNTLSRHNIKNKYAMSC